MKYLKISNKGLLDIEALTLLGASSKRGDNSKIGMFGSGNKFAIAYFLRNGYELIIYSGTNKININLLEKEFRGNKFNIICFNGKETSITTDFGKDWSLGSSIREFYCNAIDEGEHCMEFVLNPIAEEGKTNIYIRTREEITQYVSNFDFYFAENKKVLFECTYGKILEKTGESINLYRKGIKCIESNKKSVYDYDLTSVDIDENRLVKYNWQVPSLIWNLIYRCTNKEVIKNILLKCEDSNFIECIPSDFSSVNNSLMSKEYIEVLKECTIAPRSMSGLLTVEELAKTITLPDIIYKDAVSVLDNNNIATKFQVYKNMFYREIELTSLYKSTLEKAIDFFIETDYKQVTDYEWVVVKFDKKDILGMADIENNRILLSDICIESGIQQVIETVIEEYIHLKYKVKDETRGFQDAAIKEIVNLLKIKNSYLI